MKNIQVIDGANNCSYSIYAIADDAFTILFPGTGQDVEFIEDARGRLGDETLGDILREVWNHPVKKPDVLGIHGTLFYELLWKKKYYPTKRSEELRE